MTNGLYSKYTVLEDGEPVEDCFVLEPADDPAAIAAIEAYADATNDESLAEDLRAWIDSDGGRKESGAPHRFGVGREFETLPKYHWRIANRLLDMDTGEPLYRLSGVEGYANYGETKIIRESVLVDEDGWTPVVLD